MDAKAQVKPPFIGEGDSRLSAGDDAEYEASYNVR